MRRTSPGGLQLLATALLGLLAVVGFALGPVERTSGTYEFRPGETGSGGSVAPLALAERTPDRLVVRIPCDKPGSSFVSMNAWVWRSAADAEFSPLLFSDLGEALAVNVDGGSVFVEIGESEIMRLPVGDQHGCLAELDYQNGIATLSVSGRVLKAPATAFRMTEAAVGGPAASSEISEVVVTVRELGSSPSTTQWVLLMVATVLLLQAGRGIVRTVGSTERTPPERGERLKRLGGSIGTADVMVVVTLVAWLLLMPANIDDGWTGATQRAYGTSGDFSDVFLNGVGLPMGYWINWLQHFWLSMGNSALWARLPALLLGVATWIGVRSVGQVAAISISARSNWVMGGVYAVGFGAWGMTLRPEPVIAALVVASLVMAIRFRTVASGRTIVAWLVIVALGITAHPTGLLVLAPVLASTGSLWRWSRASPQNRWVAATAATLLAALVGLLLVVDTNLSGLVERFGAVRLNGVHNQSVFDELARYGSLDQTPYATVLGRLSAAFMLTAVAAFLVGRRTHRDIRSLIGWSTIIGLGLLSLVPSKWPVHFAGLIGLVALLLALELRGSDPVDGKRGTGTGSARVRPLLVLLITVGMVSYAWSISLPWTAFDLRTLHWWRGLDLSAPPAWILVGGLVLAAVVAQRSLQRKGVSDVPTPPEFVVLAVAMAAVVFTASFLVIDTVRTDGWTFGRQNVRSLLGREACGLGDEIRVPTPGSLRTLEPTEDSATESSDRIAAESGFDDGGEFMVGGFSRSSVNGTLPMGGMEEVGSWVTVGDAPGDANIGSFHSAWYRLEQGADPVVLMVMGRTDPGGGNAIAVQWGAATGSGVESVALESVGVEGYFTDWSLRIVTAPEGADRVRVLLRDSTTGSGDAWVASSLPLTVSMASVGEVTAAYRPDVMVTPSLSMYFPCVQVPIFANAVVSPPAIMVQMWQTVWQRSFAAAALADRYFRVPVTLDPAPTGTPIGSHLGDVDNFMFVSQEYLTGTRARAHGEFRMIDDDA